MIQRIHCETCGTKHFVPIDPDDALDGWQVRAVWLKAKMPQGHYAAMTTIDKRKGALVRKQVVKIDLKTMVCDRCNAVINDGDNCVAITMFRDSYQRWEHNYGEVQI